MNVKNFTINTKSIKKSKKAEQVGINLLNKFEKVKRTDAVDFLDLANETKHTTSELIREISNKINFYKQAVNNEEQLNLNFDKETKEFFIFFENFFNCFYEIKDYESFKQILNRLKTIIEENDEIFVNTAKKKEKVEILNDIEEIMKTIETNVKPEIEEKHQNQKKLKELIEGIMNFVISSDILKDYEDNVNRSKFEKKEENIPQDIEKTFKTIKKQSKLLETAYINKTKGKFGEQDEIYYDPNYISKLKDKTKHIFLRNFLQIFFIKEKGIFTESYFSKFDHKSLYSYRNFRYYELKFYFNAEESSQNIQLYIEMIISLFTKYILIYKEIKNGFIRITISGIGKKQKLFKRYLINLISGVIKKDCLAKLSHFSNLFDAVRKCIKNILYENVISNTNFTNSMMEKILERINF